MAFQSTSKRIVNILDQDKVFPIYIITVGQSKLYCFDFDSGANPLFINTLNFFCGLYQDFKWNKSEYDFTDLKAVKMSEDIRKGLDELRQQFMKSKDVSHKKDIADLCRQLESVTDGEYFLVFRLTFRHINLTITEQIKLLNRLNAVNAGMTLEEADERYKALYAPLFDSYDLFQYVDDGKNNLCVGEPERQKRICRFCGKGMPDVSFSERAHAIPEAIGNKHLFCNEECDNCNTRLHNVEDNLTNWFEFRRNQAGVRRKHGGIPHGGGRNYVLGEDQSVQVFDSNIDIKSQTEYKLQGAQTVTEQGIYKALCKIVIDLIKEEYLSRLQMTIKWINGEVKSSYYPHIAQINGLQSVAHPQEFIFVRKDGLDMDDAPFCFAVLRIFDMAILYAVPHVDNRMIFPYGYAQSFPYQGLQFFNICLDTIEWSDFSKTEVRDPHIIIDLSHSKFVQGFKGTPHPEKLLQEKRPDDWIDFPKPRINENDIHSCRITNTKELMEICQEDITCISGDVTNVKVVINILAKYYSIVSMHFIYKDVRTNKCVLSFDSNVLFKSRVIHNQIKWENDYVTIHYRLILAMIDLTLNETSKQLSNQHPHILLKRQNLSVYDAFELYDKAKVVPIT
jgi:hypothetical protein